jgi:hypothetical protein
MQFLCILDLQNDCDCGVWDNEKEQGSAKEACQLIDRNHDQGKQMIGSGANEEFLGYPNLRKLGTSRSPCALHRNSSSLKIG